MVALERKSIRLYSCELPFLATLAPHVLDWTVAFFFSMCTVNNNARKIRILLSKCVSNHDS